MQARIAATEFQEFPRHLYFIFKTLLNNALTNEVQMVASKQMLKIFQKHRFRYSLVKGSLVLANLLIIGIKV